MATCEYGFNFFLRIQFQEGRFDVKMGTTLVEGKCWLISVGLYRTVLDSVQIQKNKLANQVRPLQLHIFILLLKNSNTNNNEIINLDAACIFECTQNKLYT